MSQYASLEKMIDTLCSGHKIHVCIHDVVGLFYDGVLKLSSNRYFMHPGAFCDHAKSTADGFRLCMRCKALMNRKAVRGKKEFCGVCPFGVSEVVHPVVVDGQVVCVLYVGNVITDRAVGEKKLEAAAKKVGLQAGITVFESVEQADDLTFCFDVARLLDSYICLLFSDSASLFRSSKGRGCHQKIGELTEYLKANYASEITLKQLAALYFMNEKYLGRVFREETGYTVHGYLNRLRLGKAAEYLAGTDESVLEISLFCGYNGISYFNRVFRAQYGQTPSAYRAATRRAK